MKIQEGSVAIGALVVFSAWLFIGLPIYFGPSERIQYYDSAQAAPHGPAAEPKGTINAPFFVQVISGPKSAAEHTQEAEDREEKRSADRWLVRWTAALFAATVGLILATGVLGYFAFRQARDIKDLVAIANDAATAAKNQVALSRQALISVERALIFHSKTHCMAGIKGSTNEVIDWTFYAILENAGSTPTRYMYMHTNWYYFVGGMPENFDFRDLATGQVERVPITMGPKGSTWSAECEVPIDKILAAKNNEGNLFIWGWLEYDDIFEGTPRHRTEYCFEVKVPGVPTIFRADGNPEGAHVPFRYQGYKKHNGTDEECMNPIKTGSPKNPLQTA